MASLTGSSKSNSAELPGLWRLNLYSELCCWFSVCDIYQSFHLALSALLRENCLPQCVRPGWCSICITNSCSIRAVREGASSLAWTPELATLILAAVVGQHTWSKLEILQGKFPSAKQKVLFLDLSKVLVEFTTVEQISEISFSTHHVLAAGHAHFC